MTYNIYEVYSKLFFAPKEGLVDRERNGGTHKIVAFKRNTSKVYFFCSRGHVDWERNGGVRERQKQEDDGILSLSNALHLMARRR